MLKVCENGIPTWKVITRTLCPCLFDDKDFWDFERAPEPSDIQWENLHITSKSRCARGLLSYALAFLLMAVSAIIIFMLKNYQLTEIKTL